MSSVTSLNKIIKKANYIISALLIVIFFLVLFIHLNKEMRDLDIWLHLKTGEQILTTKTIMLSDPFSFTKEGSSWINHEWLFQVLSYKTYKHFGFNGLIIMQSIIFMAIFLIMFIVGTKNRRFLFSSIALFILLLNSNYRFTMRPDMFSVLFMVIFIFILREKNKYLYLLPLLQIMWSNIHGFFFIGPLIILVFALTENNKRLWIAFILSSLATVINPQFIKGALYPLITFTELLRDKFIFDFIQELKMPITFQTLFSIRSWFFYKALIIISLFSFRFNQKKFNLTLFLLWLVFLLFSLAAIRNIIYFAVVATFAVFYNANERFSYNKDFSNEKIMNNKYYFIGRYSLIFAVSLCMLKNAVINMDCHYYDFEEHGFRSCVRGASLRDFPEKAVDFVIKQDLPAHLFNDFNAGSYLIGRAFPLRKVFIDGRTEFYGNSFLKNYREATEGNIEKINQIITEYGLEGFLLSISSANFDTKLAKYLFNEPIWKVVYFDDTAIIFLKDTANNKRIIDKFNIDLKKWSAPKIKPRISHPHSYIIKGKALEGLGCFKAAISEAKEALKVIPNSIEALEILGNCYSELKEYELALENYRLAIALDKKAPGLMNKFALVLYKLGYLKEAEEQLLKIIKQRPKDVENYHALSLVYKKQGDFNKAEEMSKKADEFNKK